MRLRRSVALVAVALGATMAHPGHAQERAVATDQTYEPVAGLLDIPDVVGDGCGVDPPKSLDVFDSPAATAPRGSLRLAVRRSGGDVTTCEAPAFIVRAADGISEALSEESDYEVQSLVVYEHSGDWFRIALRRGSKWVRHDPRAFLAYPDLLLNRLAYVRKGWNGTLWPEPGSGAGDAVPFEWRKHLRDDVNAEVLGVRLVGKNPWIQVRLVTESCGETVPGVDPVTGWIPAYSPSGRPAAWFYSRGC
jgi:hypothetical protein